MNTHDTPLPSRVTLDVDLDVLTENFRKICAAVAPLGVIVVLKANAYGLGMRRVAESLAKAGAAAIAVAELAEAMEVVRFGVPVLLLGTVLPHELRPALTAGIRIPVAGLDEAREISRAATELHTVARCHLAIDTGMGRVGILATGKTGTAGAADEIAHIAALPNLALEGAYSHFPNAYVEGDSATRRQITTFLALAAALKQRGVKIAQLHIANSDAINNVPEARVAPFTHVRTGINLYGSFDMVGRRMLDLRPVLTLRARLAQVRVLPAGSTVGYGCTFVCPREMRVGTVAAGYADGLPLALSNRGALLIRGKRCAVIGRVSMDYTTVALDAAEDAAAGDEVICIGEAGAEAVAVEDWAALKGTHPYEVICSIGSRVKRQYTRGETAK